MSTTREMILIAFGEASMCWKPRPEGVFASEEARSVADRLEEDIRQHIVAQSRALRLGDLLEISDDNLAGLLLSNPEDFKPR